MSSKVTQLLLERRQELESISGDYSGWSDMRTWHARTRPLIAKHYSSELGAFDTIIKVQWTSLPRVSTFGGSSRNRSVNEDAKRAERKSHDGQVGNVKRRLLAHIDALIELDSTIEPERPTSHESDALFQEIDSILGQSPLPQKYKSLIAQDLSDSQKAYSGGAFKACVVMLGAALEGAMLGTLQRTDVLAHLVNAGGSAPTPIRNLGTGDPALADKIGNELTFEDYKVCVHTLIQGLSSLGVDNIQSFRNAIHPWKTIQEPLVYSSFERSRALHYIGSFREILKSLVEWSP